MIGRRTGVGRDLRWSSGCLRVQAIGWKPEAIGRAPLALDATRTFRARHGSPRKRAPTPKVNSVRRSFTKAGATFTQQNESSAANARRIIAGTTTRCTVRTCYRGVCLLRAMLIDPRTFRRLVRVRQALLANEEITIRELATQVGISSSRLIRVFAALFGDTPHRLRTKVRLERAREMLARGDDVTGVCMDVGFSSLGSFSALFTRWNGLPPSRYRTSVQVATALDVGVVPIVPGCLGMLAYLPRSTARNFREAKIA